MGPPPGFTYVQGQTFETLQFASQPGKWRVAIGTAGLDGTELPYRWGLDGELSPGGVSTATGHIKVTQDFKTTPFWAALVRPATWPLDLTGSPARVVAVRALSLGKSPGRVSQAIRLLCVKQFRL